MTICYLRIFDQVVRLSSDSPTFIEPFIWLYPRFIIDADTVGSPTMEAAIFSGHDSPLGRPSLTIDGQSWPLPDPAQMQGTITERIFYAIIERIRSHVLIHAGAVAHAGGAVVLCGDSQHGKTTLVLKLLQRGFQFLSDELAAISRTDGQVYAFPRSLRIRPESLSVAGVTRDNDAARVWYDKLLLDIDELWPERLVEKAEMRNIVLLQDPNAKTEDGGTGAGPRELLITVAGADDVLLSTVRNMEGVTQVELEFAEPYQTLRVIAQNRTDVIHQVEELCQARDILLVNIQKRQENQPDFDRRPRLTSISTSEMVIELLRRFQGTHHSPLVHSDANRRATHFFLEMADLVKGAHCYRLEVGILDDMADLVCALADQEGD